MHRDHHIFIEAIKCKKKVSITILGNSERRRYMPLFYIPARGQKACAHYYVWDEKGGKGNISRLAPAKIVSIEPTQEHFDPAGFTLVREEESSLSADSRLSQSQLKVQWLPLFSILSSSLFHSNSFFLQ